MASASEESDLNIIKIYLIFTLMEQNIICYMEWMGMTVIFAISQPESNSIWCGRKVEN